MQYCFLNIVSNTMLEIFEEYNSFRNRYSNFCIFPCVRLILYWLIAIDMQLTVTKSCAISMQNDKYKCISLWCSNWPIQIRWYIIAIFQTTNASNYISKFIDYFLNVVYCKERNIGVVVVLIVWLLDVQLPVQSVLITTRYNIASMVLSGYSTNKTARHDKTEILFVKHQSLNPKVRNILDLLLTRTR
jgi:hypothetical protein